jgi:hypothetical protein
MPHITGTVLGTDGQPLDGARVGLYRKDTGEHLGGMVTPIPPVDAGSILWMRLENDAADYSSPSKGTFVNNGGVTFDGTKATFNGENYLSQSVSGIPAIGVGDFTVDMTGAIPIANVYNTFISDGTANFSIHFNDSSGLLAYIGGGNHTFTFNIPIGPEFYFRIKRVSGVVSCFLNGAQVDAPATLAGDVTAFTNLEIGRLGAFGRFWPAGGTLRHVRLVNSALPGNGEMAPLTPLGGTGGSPGSFKIDTTYTGDCVRVIQSPYADRNHLIANVTPGGD